MNKRYRVLVYILCFFICKTSSAQEKIITTTSEYYDSILESSYQSKVHKISSSRVLPKTKKSEGILSYVEYLSFQHQLIQYKSNTIPNNIAIDISFRGENYPLIFKRNYLKGQGYTVSSSSKTKHQESDAIYYHGIIEGQTNSWATLAIIDGEYKILIASKEGNIEVTKADEFQYAVYMNKDFLEEKNYICGSVDKEMNQEERSSTNNRMIGSDCVELYVECDYQSFLDNGNNVASTEAWALSIVNDVAAIYATINIPLVISEVFVWNTVDPYQQLNNTVAIRDTFVNRIQNNYTGRVGQLYSTRDVGGGLAYGLGGLCGTFPDFPGPYSIATSLVRNYNPFPNYSFTVNVVAHELGHVFGARHTHACVWGPNFDSQIDDCGNVHATNNNDTPEGGVCYDVANPVLPTNGGTIMSFCNLAGGGINLSNGFAPEVGDFISASYNSTPCSTGNVCAAIPPSNDACINAIEIPIRGICNYSTFDNILSTSSGVIDPSCGNVGIAQDVWFSFTPSNSTVQLFFNPVATGVEDVVITVYTGNCGSLNEIECQSIQNQEEKITLTNLTSGDNYFVRVIESGSDLTGEFQLCLTDDALNCHPAVEALVDLYNSSGGGNWTNSSGWQNSIQDANCDVCNWYGITCDNQLNVIGIDLFNNNLVGSVPNSLNQLDKLRTIKLNNNTLSGSFPDIWIDMVDLEFIDLSNNLFTGSIPISLSVLSKLATLYIENNNLTGELLPELGNLALLNVFWVKNNNLQGCYPDEYANLCNRGSIKFTNNPLLTGEGNTFDSYCTTGLGSDVDNDGFCLGSGVGEDCVDTDNTIYWGAPELCDGKDNNCDGQFDESITQTNTWQPSGGGNWTVASNWSLGIIPEGCHDVIIPSSNSSRLVSINFSEQAFARSITIGNNSALINMGSLTVSGSDSEGVDLSLGSTFINNGSSEIKNAAMYGITAEGTITNNGIIKVSNLSLDIELYIQLNGSLINNGIIEVK